MKANIIEQGLKYRKLQKICNPSILTNTLEIFQQYNRIFNQLRMAKLIIQCE